MEEFKKGDKVIIVDCSPSEGFIGRVAIFDCVHGNGCRVNFGEYSLWYCFKVRKITPLEEVLE